MPRICVRVGAAPLPVGATGIPSEWSASRATSSPDSGTITSRGPAARKSGTSNPAVRRRTLGTPSSSRMFWISSASAWLRPPATRARGPCVYSGWILRARSCASSRTGSSSPSRTSGIPQSRQNRSSGGCSSPQAGQASVLLDDDVFFADTAVLNSPGAHLRLAGERDDQVAPVWVEGEVDVGLRRLGRAARVRVVDRHAVAVVVEVVGREQRLRVDLVAVRRGAQVLRAMHLVDPPVGEARVAAAFIRRLVARMLDKRVPVGL